MIRVTRDVLLRYYCISVLCGVVLFVLCDYACCVVRVVLCLVLLLLYSYWCAAVAVLFVSY